MKRLVAGFLVLVALVSMTVPAYSSDWDKAGKALTIIEGLRLITGGRVDFIGTLSGLNQPKAQERYVTHYHSRKPKYEKVWIPHYVWKSKYIPEHEEYSQEYGAIIVEGHYIRYRVEQGGRWETKQYSRSRCDF